MPVAEICTLMPAVTHRFRTELKARIRTAGIDISLLQFDAIVFLAQQSPVNPHELADLLERDRGQTTRLVNDLEQRGLAVRAKSEADGRCQLLSLTEEGRELFSRLWTIRVKLADEILAGFSDDECARFLGFLERVRDQPLP